MEHKVHPLQLSFEFDGPCEAPLDCGTSFVAAQSSNVVCFEAFRALQRPIVVTPETKMDSTRLYQGILDSIRHFAY